MNLIGKATDPKFWQETVRNKDCYNQFRYFAKKDWETYCEGKAVAAHADDDDIIIAADTVVAVDDRVLGKPHSRAEAVEMLTMLSGRSHTVYTGVTVRKGETVCTQHECTRVTFRPLTGAEIEAYVDSKEPMDKAGSYGIQGLGCLLVQGIEGDYYNVMGLPVCRLGQMLRTIGFDVLSRE